MRKLLLIDVEKLLPECSIYADKIRNCENIVTAEIHNDDINRKEINDLLSNSDDVIVFIDKDNVNLGKEINFFRTIRPIKPTFLIDSSDNDTEELDWVIYTLEDHVTLRICDDRSDLIAWFTQTCKEYF